MEEIKENAVCENQDVKKNNPIADNYAKLCRDGLDKFLRARINFKKSLLSDFYFLLEREGVWELKLDIEKTMSENELRCECSCGGLYSPDSQYVCGIMINKSDDELMIIVHSEKLNYDTKTYGKSDDMISFYQFASKYEHNVEALVRLYELLIRLDNEEKIL